MIWTISITNKDTVFVFYWCITIPTSLVAYSNANLLSQFPWIKSHISVLVSYYHYNKLPQTSLFETTQIYCCISGAWKPEVKFTKLKLRCQVLARLVPSGCSLERVHHPAIFQLLVVTCIPWLVASSSFFEMHCLKSLLLFSHWLLLSWFSCLSYKDIYDCIYCPPS